MPFEIVRNDITKMPVDAIVNAANTSLKMGGGVCGAIFQAAGARELQVECDKLGGIKTGEAVLTKGYKLPAKYIIHTAGPVWEGGSKNEESLLYNCYKNSLELAKDNGCVSIAFPVISSGIYGYPKEEAIRVAIAAISDFLFHNEMMVYLVVFDRKAFVLSEKLFSKVEKYIDDNYAEENELRRGPKNEARYLEETTVSYSDANAWVTTPTEESKAEHKLEHMIFNLEESFSQTLLRLIDEKGMTDVEIYKKANMDRKLFSKIRSDKDYRPSKITAIALAIALQLNEEETQIFLGKAGYVLSNSNKFDVIIRYFIEAEKYDIFLINETLFAFDQSLLGV